MQELKPCPFCGESASIYGKDGQYWVECHGCGATARYDTGQTIGVASNTETAANAWNRRAQQQENKPLTLEELREMDGEPVWIDFPTLPSWEPKCKVMLHYNDSLKYISWYDCSNYGTNGYGKVWLAYRRKPEVQDE